jgi:hypothetical protein
LDEREIIAILGIVKILIQIGNLVAAAYAASKAGIRRKPTEREEAGEKAPSRAFAVP